ncbi:hypothetical protein HBI26_010270 [Parastagonospora nodorum]|nr:hypothetical protein HBI76_042190 [Parastagonospora nodorum]KAH5426194.1 hypothetical protein HBI46_044040 [Parastagonospora nodorum]KAH5614116.1 hypothetical protein HBI26_010270 [Parastagonospora nodorum]
MAATQDAQDDPAAPRMQHITTTTAPDFPEDAKTFRRLAEVCRANPSMRIHYQLPAWIFHEQEELIMFGHALQALFTFRENRLFHDLLEDFPRSTGLVPVLTRIVNVLDSVVAWRKDVRVRDMWADNLRFFPTHTEEDRASLKPSGLGGWDHVPMDVALTVAQLAIPAALQLKPLKGEQSIFLPPRKYLTMRALMDENPKFVPFTRLHGAARGLAGQAAGRFMAWGDDSTLSGHEKMQLGMLVALVGEFGMDRVVVADMVDAVVGVWAPYRVAEV